LFIAVRLSQYKKVTYLAYLITIYTRPAQRNAVLCIVYFFRNFVSFN